MDKQKRQEKDSVIFRLTNLENEIRLKDSKENKNIDNSHIPWIEKYRPNSIREMYQSENIIQMSDTIIKTGEMTHLLLYGPPGTGKTSVILALCKELFGEYYRDRVLEFNASDDRGINAVRELISHDARKYVAPIITAEKKKIPGFKVIILDEADLMTEEAQDALRVIIEQYSGVTRFCFICNYINKITDAIKSRCTSVYFKKLEHDAAHKKLKSIMKSEKMVLSDEIIDTLIEVSQGDMRKAIGYLQNTKYLYHYKQIIHKPMTELKFSELKSLAHFHGDDINPTITVSDIRKIAAMLPKDQIEKIIKDVIECKSIIEVMVLNRTVIATGYPVDNTIEQLNDFILETNLFDDITKAKIIKYSGDILLKMKECASETIQLLDYLAYIYSVVVMK